MEHMVLNTSLYSIGFPHFKKVYLNKKKPHNYEK